MAKPQPLEPAPVTEDTVSVGPARYESVVGTAKAMLAKRAHGNDILDALVAEGFDEPEALQLYEEGMDPLDRIATYLGRIADAVEKMVAPPTYETGTPTIDIIR